MNKSYHSILFDWDGCLARTLEVWLQAYRDELSVRGFSPSNSEISRHFGDSKLGEYLGVEDLREFNRSVVARATEQLHEVELYDGARQALALLGDRSHQLALISSSPREVLLTGLRHNNLDNVFSIIISGDDITHHKPHPEPLEKALSALGGDKHSSIIVGDSSKDIGAAHNFEIDSVLIYHPSHEIFYNRASLEAEQPTYIIEKLSDLPSIIG